MSSRASPPDAETVQMSPPETKASSRRSGESEGSEKLCFAARGAVADGPRVPGAGRASAEMLKAAAAAARVEMDSIVGLRSKGGELYQDTAQSSVPPASR